MSVIYGNEFQQSLRDVVFSHSAPNAEALGYCPAVPPGLQTRLQWDTSRSGNTRNLQASPQHRYPIIKFPPLAVGDEIDWIFSRKFRNV